MQWMAIVAARGTGESGKYFRSRGTLTRNTLNQRGLRTETRTHVGSFTFHGSRPVLARVHHVSASRRRNALSCAA